MSAAVAASRLVDRLPSVRGRLTPEQPLSALTWFRVGGPAEVLFVPADEADLSTFLQALPSDIPVTVAGVGSNLLVRDGGIDGVVIRLGKGFATISQEPGNKLRAGVAALDAMVAKAAAKAGVAGLEFYRGIPGSIGGALRMNAGCYGRETKDVLVEAVVLDRQGNRHVIPAQEMGFSYRHTSVPPDFIFIEALFQGAAGDPIEITARMDEITRSRESTQPIRERTGGSTFRNPDGFKAWQLIDAAGGRGARRGGAQVSELHCNFLINKGGATAADLEGLGEDMRARVREQSGVELQWEIKRIGKESP